MKIITAENGSKQKAVDVEKIIVIDLWHIAMSCPDKKARAAILDVWHLAHDMRGALCAIANGADISKPVHTK